MSFDQGDKTLMGKKHVNILNPTRKKSRPKRKLPIRLEKHHSQNTIDIKKNQGYDQNIKFNNNCKEKKKIQLGVIEES